jgi:Flp pilus assembly protein TadD
MQQQQQSMQQQQQVPLARAPQQQQQPTQALYRAGNQQNQQQYYRPAQQFSAPAQQMQGQQSAALPVNQSNNLSRKNLYEGGSGSTGPAAGMNFRTHDESENSAAPQATATTSDAGTAAQKPVDSITRLNMAEAQRDYASAIAILQTMVSDNLQNPDMHHRLAVNLMSAGQMSEAISEFRIASALSPTQKTYADDLARAMAIHKKSLSSDGSGVPQ